MYLLVPGFGYLCDRHGPGTISLLSALLFGTGYLLAAFTYRSGPPPSAGGNGWTVSVMVLAFFLVGTGTSSMYLSAVTTAAKNFGRGKNKGIALAIPIASFGLSGMILSQIGSNLLYEHREDGSHGDVDVYRFFLFLACLLIIVGLLGGLTLQIVSEEELIDDAVDELERSGLLDSSDFFQHAIHQNGYGTVLNADLSESQVNFLQSKAEEIKLRQQEEQRKKNWLLNEETRRFLKDKTMWFLAAGFFLVTGPGEAFINNLGTIIGTLHTPDTTLRSTSTSAATHVSIVAVSSTIARLLTGTLTDALAPTEMTHRQKRQRITSTSASIESLRSYAEASEKSDFHVSRISFLILFALILSAGQVLLASGAVQNHAGRFAFVSTLVGAGYGAVFSLVPIIISVVWGVENFGTNWGVVAMVPAVGAAVWGFVYSAVYQNATTFTSVSDTLSASKNDALCHGTNCYAPTFWAMAVSVWVACALWFWAWRGPGGWKRKGIAV